MHTSYAFITIIHNNEFSEKLSYSKVYRSWYLFLTMTLFCSFRRYFGWGAKWFIKHWMCQSLRQKNQVHFFYFIKRGKKSRHKTTDWLSEREGISGLIWWSSSLNEVSEWVTELAFLCWKWKKGEYKKYWNPSPCIT